MMRARHGLWPLLPLLLLASCKGEPDFDERYDQQAENLEAAAQNMQQDLENRMAVGNLLQPAPPADLQAEPANPDEGQK